MFYLRFLAEIVQYELPYKKNIYIANILKKKYIAYTYTFIYV